MRTSNKHPHWQHHPLRLNNHQMNNPTLIIEEFFDCFHLGEVRDILWDWMVEVVTSERSISQEAIDRRNHFFFYEKLESLVEAALLLKNRSKKRRRKRRRGPAYPKNQ